MTSIILATTLGTVLYLIMEVLVIFGGAMFFTWLVIICVRRFSGSPRRGQRHKDTTRNPSVVELRYLVESTRLQTEKLRLEQERLRQEERE